MTIDERVSGRNGFNRGNKFPRCEHCASGRSHAGCQEERDRSARWQRTNAIAKPATASHVEFLTVESRLHQRLLDELDRRNILAAERRNDHAVHRNVR